MGGGGRGPGGPYGGGMGNCCAYGPPVGIGPYPKPIIDYCEKEAEKLRELLESITGLNEGDPNYQNQVEEEVFRFFLDCLEQQKNAWGLDINANALTGMTLIAWAIYLLISEGSRVCPPRNLIPIP
jgi:hypothetical protein